MKPVAAWMQRRRWELALVWLISAATRLPRLGFPHSTVFDEVYFKQFTQAYFTHKYYFDIHPPLGKLILAGWAKLIGANPATLTAAPATGLRWLVALAGTAIAPVVYGIVRRLTGSRLAASTAAFMAALDGALIVESRLVLVDSLLLLFGLAAIYAALRFERHLHWGWLAAAGLLMGMAAGIKWTGLAPCLIAGLIITAALYARRLRPVAWLPRLALPLVLMAAVYLGAFALHFALLTKSGPGDAFMSPRFQATLTGSPYYNPAQKLSFWQKTWELNREMYEANKTLTATHPYGSKWYTWPLEERPVYFWEGSVGPQGRQGNIYLLGNPVTWWLGSAAVVAALILLLQPAGRRRLGALTGTVLLLLIAYLADWLPFAGIGRVMFLYHYLFAYIFSLMILAVLITKLVPPPGRRRAALALLVLTTAGFVYFSPFTYGQRLAPAQMQERVWLPGWR